MDIFLKKKIDATFDHSNHIQFHHKLAHVTKITYYTPYNDKTTSQMSKFLLIALVAMLVAVATAATLSDVYEYNPYADQLSDEAQYDLLHAVANGESFGFEQEMAYFDELVLNDDYDEDYELQATYTVKSGDTLSGIGSRYGMFDNYS